MPALTPVSTPVAAVIVATDPLELIQVPPVAVFVNVVVAPMHPDPAPEIVPGVPFTVVVTVAAVPHPVLYDIMLVPAVMPDNKPVEGLMVAVVGALLLHVPPVSVLLRVVVPPAHKLVVPVIPAGPPFIVTANVAAGHPLARS